MVFRNSARYNQLEQGLRKHPRAENITPRLLLIETVEPVICYCNRTECSEAVISVDEYHFLSGATPYKNLHVILVIHPLLIYSKVPAVVSYLKF
jgi:hypothetical protein